MNANNVWLDIANDRLQFWRGQLQDAFRDRDTEHATVCGHMVKEYSQVTREAITQFRKLSQSTAVLSHREHDRPERSVAGADVRFLKQHVDSMLDENQASGDLLVDVSRAICACMMKGSPTLNCVARALAVSPRTLERRLARHGVVFSAHVSEIRRKMAFEYLSRGEHSFAQIAVLLAYSEASAFSRAFKRWTGVTPQQYRCGKREA
jgi:AraC-like DNA-binding protein